MPEFRFNHIYEPVFDTDCRIIDIWGGRGRGGSHFGTDYFLNKITQPYYFRGYFVRKVFNDIRDSLFRDFNDRLEENPTLNPDDFIIRENDMRIIYKPTGNMILSKGITKDGGRTAKMKSLAGATHVLIEEADEVEESDFNQLDLSLRTTKADKVQIFRIFNPPPKRHWIWRDYNLTESDIEGWYQATVKSSADILSVFSTYHDNIRNLQSSTISRFESFLIDDPDYYYNQVRGLVSEGAKGRIYSGWQPMSYKEFKELDMPSVYVLDFGYSNDPNALIELKAKNQHRYIHELLYETGLDNLSLAKRMRDLGITSKDIVIADMGSGGDLRIAELRRGWQNIDGYSDLRFNIYPAIKGAGSILFGINKVKSCTVYMTEESKNGWIEVQEYKWRLDADKNPTDTPVDNYNHLMDCVRMGENSKGRLF